MVETHAFQPTVIQVGIFYIIQCNVLARFFANMKYFCAQEINLERAVTTGLRTQ